MKRFLLVVLSGAFLMFPSFGYAADARAGEQISIRQDDVIVDDLYIVGGNIVVAGSVEGDLIAAGGTVLVTGSVKDDLLIGGGTVDLLGPVNGDVRAAGGEVTIGGIVASDLVVAGGIVHIVPGAEVKGSILMAGGELILEGKTSGNVRVFGGKLTINGEVGNVRADIDQLEVGPEGVIAGHLVYKSGHEAQIDASARVAGDVDFQKKEKSKKPFVLFGGFAIFKLLTFLVLALVFMLLFQKQSVEFVRDTAHQFWRSCLRGLITFIVAPVIILILFVSILGIAMGILALLLYLALLIMSCVYTGILFGSMIFKKVFHKHDFETGWDVVVTGFLVLFLLNLIPFLGALISLVFFLATLGGFTGRLRDRLVRNMAL